MFTVPMLRRVSCLPAARRSNEVVCFSATAWPAACCLLGAAEASAPAEPAGLPGSSMCGGRAADPGGPGTTGWYLGSLELATLCSHGL